MGSQQLQLLSVIGIATAAITTITLLLTQSLRTFETPISGQCSSMPMSTTGILTLKKRCVVVCRRRQAVVVKSMCIVSCRVLVFDCLTVASGQRQMRQRCSFHRQPQLQQHQLDTMMAFSPVAASMWGMYRCMTPRFIFDEQLKHMFY